ncbi:hypothetical protein ABB37_06392 [Leptomonas pyrrhocoris]|uniref:RanBP2-type domain-containing protein n=1 Tax=Leptomonas pyrrhocoris TaxID=157538 RepID=A0A0M9FXZ6_LEPPY|nr:hypothetical protein ABB37_06392 [Leptomonas pyrrhocoris]KPA78237.1 hypothetical protein ABB37_06392 [Leptomonas pyrrhocoris]|eukprot:XP_015656676.1 hypothetical protein ABB37_06392 [Leptomonas pyrrhocoris]
MLRLTPRRDWHVSRVLNEKSVFRRVMTLPRGMQRFEPSSPATTKTSHEPGKDRATPRSLTPVSSPSSQSATDTPTTGVGRTPYHPHLPPWPVDAIEFNALSVDGGQGARRTWLRNNPQNGAGQHPLNMVNGANGSHLGDDGGEGWPDAGFVPKTVPLTPEVRTRVATEEESPAAQAALAVGGWVCTGCWAVQGVDSAAKAGERLTEANEAVSEGGTSDAMCAAGKALFPRTICPACRTLRHDAEAWPVLAALRTEDADRCVCRQCGEVNRNSSNRSAASTHGHAKTEHTETPVCRCCGTACTSDASRRCSIRQTVEDEVAAGPLGHIVVTRNRTSRWRCCGCNEVNSLKQTECRNCARERFALTVCCPSCETPRVLTNALVYGYRAGTSTTTQGATLSADAQPYVAPPVFSLLNCYHMGSTQVMCQQCGSSLHGGVIRSFTHGSTPWWCACGVMNPTQAYSCCRCRLPRTVSKPSLLTALLRGVVTADASLPHYDFATCTSWLCDSCDGVNHASYQVITERDEEACTASSCSAEQGSSSPCPTKRKSRAWVDAGEVECGHCGAPWHYQRLQNGEWWRCACHALNKRDNTLCTSCGLPALGRVQAIVLSSWSRGDWWCFACSTHNYRERMRCRCGACRPPSG